MAIELAFDYPSLEMTEADYLKEMGYRTQEPRQEVLEVLRLHEQRLRKGLRASCAYVLLGGEASASKVMLGETTLEVGDVLGRLLNGADRFAVFAATAGMYFQEYYERLKQDGDMLPLFVLDVMGSCMVEKVGDLMEKSLEGRIAPCRHTARFSPGYCGWQLTEQRKLFRLLEGHCCGISLQESCLMYPLKSISGIVGIGEQVTERKYGCDICNLLTCYKRKNKKKSI